MSDGETSDSMNEDEYEQTHSPGNAVEPHTEEIKNTSELPSIPVEQTNDVTDEEDGEEGTDEEDEVVTPEATYNDQNDNQFEEEAEEDEEDEEHEDHDEHEEHEEQMVMEMVRNHKSNNSYLHILSFHFQMRVCLGNVEIGDTCS